MTIDRYNGDLYYAGTTIGLKDSQARNLASKVKEVISSGRTEVVTVINGQQVISLVVGPNIPIAIGHPV